MDHRESIAPGLLERPRPTIFAATVMLLIATAGLWISSLLAARVVPADAESQSFWVSALYYLPFVALPIALYMLRRPGLSTAMRLNPMPVLPVFAVVFAALLSVYVASAVDSLWGLILDAVGLHEPQASVEMASSRALTLAILHSAAIPAVCEELLCRGVVFSAFESRGTRLAVWVSSLLFALMHGNLYGLPAYLMVGAISAFLVFALNSLYAGMIYHTVYNTVILVFLYLMPEADVLEAAADAVSPLSVVVDAATFGLLLFLLLRSVNLLRLAKGIEPVPRIRQPLRRGEWALLMALAMVFIGTCALVLMGV